jgi:hypothetical protein
MGNVVRHQIAAINRSNRVTAPKRPVECLDPTPVIGRQESDGLTAVNRISSQSGSNAVSTFYNVRIATLDTILVEEYVVRIQGRSAVKQINDTHTLYSSSNL